MVIVVPCVYVGTGYPNEPGTWGFSTDDMGAGPFTGDDGNLTLVDIYTETGTFVSRPFFEMAIPAELTGATVTGITLTGVFSGATNHETYSMEAYPLASRPTTLGTPGGTNKDAADYTVLYGDAADGDLLGTFDCSAVDGGKLPQDMTFVLDAAAYDPGVANSLQAHIDAAAGWWGVGFKFQPEDTGGALLQWDRQQNPSGYADPFNFVITYSAGIAALRSRGGVGI